MFAHSIFFCHFVMGDEYASIKAILTLKQIEMFHNKIIQFLFEVMLLLKGCALTDEYKIY